MRTFLILFVTVVLSANVTLTRAQQPGVAINTNGNTPHSSAMLDVQSTDKGFLLPRMTTAQMFAIPAPAAGLMVFNTSYNELYQYNGTSWRPILNGNYWLRPITSRDIIANTADSIAIGLSVPTRKLDVNGTMRVRDNITADEGVGAKTLSASGNLLIGGTGVINGSLQSNDEVVINSSSAILQMKVGTENKGYLQLSGDDIRIGTNVGNTDGNFIVRLNGTEQVKVNNEGLSLPNNGKIMRSSTGTASLIPLCYAMVGSDGYAIGETDNMTVTHHSTGLYTISCPGLNSSAVVMVTPRSPYVDAAGFINQSGTATVEIRTINGLEHTNSSFNVVIFQR